MPQPLSLFLWREWRRDGIFCFLFMPRSRMWNLHLREGFRDAWFKAYYDFFYSLLKRIFIPERDEIIGGRRKLHNEEIHNLYSSSDTIRTIESRRICAVHVASLRYKINVGRVLVWNSEGKRPLRRPRHRWDDNIILHLEKRMGCSGVHSSDSE
jgi:hypothetical protein